MAKCPVCGIDIPHWNSESVPSGHLIVSKSAVDSHIHVHGNLENKLLMRELLETAQTECHFDLSSKNTLTHKEYIFHNRQRIGDMLMFTCGIRDFKLAYPEAKVGVVGTAMHIWDNSPYITPDLCIKPSEFESVIGGDLIKEASSERMLIKIGPSRLTNSSNRIDWHFANAFRVSMEDALHIHIPQGESRPDIWFTEDEYNAPRVDSRPYWIICVNGELGWGCKMYPFDRWQEFVSQNPDVVFYQIGAKGDKSLRLKGDNIVDYVGKTEDKNTGVRDLFKLFLNAEGSIGLVSFHMHLSGALHKPAIIVAGAREPVSFTQYAGHRYMATDGCLPCGVKACWHCDINNCKNLVHINHCDPMSGSDLAKTEDYSEKVPKCVDMITPEDLTRALNMYYIGRRLKKDVPSAKSKLNNIIKGPSIIAASAIQEVPQGPKVDISKYGIEWGGSGITDRDWDFMRSTIEKNNVKTVLEFGTGLPTLLMNDLGLKVVTYETTQSLIDQIKKLNPNIDIRLWDGKNLLEFSDKYDMAFVDGPAGGANREQSTKIASEVADVVIIHDAGRENERKWQDKYIKGKFDGPGKGGHRCHVWIKKDYSNIGVGNSDSQPTISTNSDDVLCVIENKPLKEHPISNKTGKYIKFVSTARGWGGCARSITTIMKMLLDAGHRVEFIPFRNSVGSQEFKHCLSTSLQDVKVSLDYTTLKEQCDVLVVYADDYVWEFKTSEVADIFSEIAADHKVMVVNYRIGSIGITPWTQGWDKYLFLNSNQENELLKLCPQASTRVLSPCADLTDFLEVQPNYDGPIRIVRHNSQGDTKFAKDCGNEIQAMLNCRQDLGIKMMPGPSFVAETDRFKKVPKNDPPIPQFLGTGNLFWYSLPQGYMDAGPRVVIEAMAAGLPVLADNWGGTVDRVTPETGWICNTKEQMVDIVKNITTEELRTKGIAAKERAKQEFVANNWIKEIIE